MKGGQPCARARPTATPCQPGLMKPEINLDALREVLGATAVIRTMERELVKPQVNTAAIWKYFTTSVYTSGDLVSIATREALQNGLDAVRAAQKQGLLKKGEGWFDASWDAERGALSWEDNGIGMDRDTVRDKFLSLGDSGKAAAADSQQAAGGFGVAKAVILGLSEYFEWDLHTRDVLATSRRGQDIELRSATARRGTRITVFDIDRDFDSQFDYARSEYVSLIDRLRLVTVLEGTARYGWVGSGALCMRDRRATHAPPGNGSNPGKTAPSRRVPPATGSVPGATAGESERSR